MKSHRNAGPLGRTYTAKAIAGLLGRTHKIRSLLSKRSRKDPTGGTLPMLVLPWKEPLEVEWIIEQFTRIEMEEQETVSGKKYHHYTHRKDPNHKPKRNDLSRSLLHQCNRHRWSYKSDPHALLSLLSVKLVWVPASNESF